MKGHSEWSFSGWAAKLSSAAAVAMAACFSGTEAACPKQLRVVDRNLLGAVSLLSPDGTYAALPREKFYQEVSPEAHLHFLTSGAKVNNGDILPFNGISLLETDPEHLDVLYDRLNRPDAETKDDGICEGQVRFQGESKPRAVVTIPARLTELKNVVNNEIPYKDCPFRLHFTGVNNPDYSIATGFGKCGPTFGNCPQGYKQYIAMKIENGRFNYVIFTAREHPVGKALYYEAVPYINDHTALSSVAISSIGAASSVNGEPLVPYDNLCVGLMYYQGKWSWSYAVELGLAQKIAGKGLVELGVSKEFTREEYTKTGHANELVFFSRYWHELGEARGQTCKQGECTFN